MPNNYRTTKPNWAPHAVPTARGWEDPKTGELLVAIRGIDLELFASESAVEANAEPVLLVETQSADVQPVEQTQTADKKQAKRGQK